MTPSNGKQHGTLYEQVLDFARREIEDASSKIDELRRSLHLLEARVEAAKSVYESVAARLNLEDELENEEVQRDAPLYAAPTPPPSAAPSAQPEPPMFAPEPPAQAPPPAPEPAPQAPISQQPSPPAPSVAPSAQPEPSMSAPEPPAQAPPPAPEPAPQASASPSPPASDSESASAASGSNGAPDGFSMDLIRRHLEARDKAAQEASAGPPRRSEDVANAPSEAPPAPSSPAPAAAAPAEPGPTSEASPEQPAAQGGFPGLSEADRALIGEYLRSKRGT